MLILPNVLIHSSVLVLGKLVLKTGDASAHSKSYTAASSARGLEPLFVLHPLFPQETFLLHLREQWGLWFCREIIHFQRKKVCLSQTEKNE